MIAMFEEKENPGYEKLAQEAKGFVVEWLHNDWYESSTEPKAAMEEASA